jgi:ubiquinone/menaquinone biosynthesis C-methylase UbiE
MTEIADPSFNYEVGGQGYSNFRQTDEGIAAYINHQLKDCHTILNVGAGTGSYEPSDKYVVAVEPSSVMRAQRVEGGRLPAVNGTSENLPFDDNSFDGCTAMLTIHHWRQREKGLLELKRVSKKKVVILTFDPDAFKTLWNGDYFSEAFDIESQRFPSIKEVCDVLGGRTEVIPVPVTLNCKDQFIEALYGKPEAFLRPEVRKAQSLWGFLPEGMEQRIVKKLQEDLTSGAWEKKHGHLRTLPEFQGALRLVVLSK